MILLPLAVLPVVLSANGFLPMCFAVVPAQAKQSAAAGSGGPTAKLGAAAPEMQDLIRAISGRWNSVFKFEPGPEMPNGAEVQGQEIWQPLAGGLVLSDEEEINLPGNLVHLLGLIWWDRADKQFHGMQCVSRSPHACDLKAALQDVSIKWDGKQLTIEEKQTSADGKKALWHETFSEITPTSFLQVGELWELDGLHKKIVTVHGSRTPE